jgi:diadenosine tetraphosphate (Ap4A) HIT family hydrolase
LPKQHDDCLFCSIAREGAYVHQGKGFVAIHVETFREVDTFDAKESKRMLEFVAETAEKVGLRDYRVLVNVGPSAGQTVFHLHWHIIGGGPGSVEDVPSAVATAEIEEEK